MDYQVLSPWGEKDNIARGLQPRVTDLENKTIGMFITFLTLTLRFYGKSRGS